MQKPPWTIADLDRFVDDEPLAYSIPGETPGHGVDLEAAHELFHEQTKYHRATSRGRARRIRAHIEEPPLIAKCVLGRHRRVGKGVSLPAPTDISGSLGEVLANRKSVRREQLGAERLVCVKLLSNMLYHSVRTNRQVPVKKVPGLMQDFRPYPSAGALYPCEVYLAIANVEGLSPGIYRYDARQHDLLLCKSHPDTGRPLRDFSDVETEFYETPPACAVIMTAVFERSVRKYGARGYRLALIEAGHILQNLSLVASAIDLKGLVSASFYEAELENLLGIDGVSEAVLAAFLMGQMSD